MILYNMKFLQFYIALEFLIFLVSANEITFLKKNIRYCSTPDGGRGCCLSILHCPQILRLAKRGLNNFTTCYFRGNIPYVCCPKKSEPIVEDVNSTRISPPKTVPACGERGVLRVRIPLSIISYVPSASFSNASQPERILSLKPIRVFESLSPVSSSESIPLIPEVLPEVSSKPESFLDSLPTTGSDYYNSNLNISEYIDYIGPTVVGGVVSERNSWPWMALLGRRVNLGEIEWFCDGVLINDQWLLTAAHCLEDKTPFFVRLGEHDNSLDVIDFFQPLDIQVQQIIRHPMYNIGQGYHDIALLQLQSRVSFVPEVSPICLPWDHDTLQTYEGSKAVVTGWGAEQFGGFQSPVLREANLEVFSPQNCESTYSTLIGHFQQYPRGLRVGDIICAGDRQGGKDTCQGDSGGPLIIEEGNGSYILIGIVSKGYGCGLQGFPGLYTPVNAKEHLHWIKAVAFA